MSLFDSLKNHLMDIENEVTGAPTEQVVTHETVAPAEVEAAAAPIVADGEKVCSCGKPYTFIPGQQVTCACGAIHA